MKNRHLRLCQTVFLVLVVAAILLSPRVYCEIVTIIPEKVVEVIVTLTSDFPGGKLTTFPLLVKFSGTAEAKIHYEDEYDDGTEGGSFEPEPKPRYRYEPVTPTLPPDDTIEEPGTYHYIATAEYGGVKGEATLELEVLSCDGLQAKVDKALEDLLKAEKERDRIKAEITTVETKIAEAQTTIGELTARIKNLENFKEILILRLLIAQLEQADPDELKQRQDAIDEISKIIRQREVELKKAEKAKKELEQKLPGLKSSFDKCVQRVSELRDNYNILNKLLQLCLGLK